MTKKELKDIYYQYGSIKGAKKLGISKPTFISYLKYAGIEIKEVGRPKKVKIEV